MDENTSPVCFYAYVGRFGNKFDKVILLKSDKIKTILPSSILSSFTHLYTNLISNVILKAYSVQRLFKLH